MATKGVDPLSIGLCFLNTHIASVFYALQVSSEMHGSFYGAERKTIDRRAAELREGRECSSRRIVAVELNRPGWW